MNQSKITPHSDTSQRSYYFPNLDGLRFFAFFSVFLAHAFYSENELIVNTTLYQLIITQNKVGTLGVNFFFVLSGFLITYLLILERDKTGSINLKKFYMRRVLRIWPLYYTIVVIGYFLFPIAKQVVAGEYVQESNLTWYIFFVSNLLKEQPQSAILGILWSIAVEEQFYLVWPLLVKAFPRKHFDSLFIGIIILSAIFRQFYLQDVYSHSLSCMSDLAMGGWIAHKALQKSSLIQWIERLNKVTIGLLYLIGFSIVITKAIWTSYEPLYTHSRLFFSIFFGFIILEQNYARNSIVKVGQFGVLTKLGRLTYGLYMIHFIAIYIVIYALRYLGFDNSIFNTVFVSPLISLTLSLVLAQLSFKILEQPFLRLKSKFDWG